MPSRHRNFDQDLLMVVTGNATFWQRFKVKTALLFKRSCRLRAQEFGLVSNAFAHAYAGHGLAIGLGMSLRTMLLLGILVIVGTTAVMLRPIITAEAAESTPQGVSSRGEDCSTPETNNKSGFSVTLHASEDCVEARTD